MLRKIPVLANNVLHSKKSTITIISRFNSINTHASNLISLEKKEKENHSENTSPAQEVNNSSDKCAHYKMPVYTKTSEKFNKNNDSNNTNERKLLFDPDRQQYYYIKSNLNYELVEPGRKISKEKKKVISEELKKDSIGNHLSTAWTIFQKNLTPLREIGINEDYGVAEKIGRLHCVKILENFDNDLGFGADLIVKLMGFLNSRNKDFPLEHVSIGRNDLGKARECISYWKYALNELIKKDKISNKCIVLDPDIPFSERKKIEISINNINSMIYMYYHPEYVNKSAHEIVTKAK